MKGMEHLRRKHVSSKKSISLPMAEEEKAKESRRVFGWRQVVCLCLSFLWIVYEAVFVIRFVTMSRPTWLYGSPMSGSSAACPSSPSELRWEWYNATGAVSDKKKLLLAQYTGHGKYAQLMDLVAPVHLAYAHKWGHDVLLLQGSAMDLSCPTDAQATFDKIPLLQIALSEGYQQVLILDTDALIVNFDIDLYTLIPKSSLLAAHRVWPYDWTNTWDVNAGITLWNLEHPLALQVANEWHEMVHRHPRLVQQHNDDQFFLQRVLMGYTEWWNPLAWLVCAVMPTLEARGLVDSRTEEFFYYQGSLIQHFKRDERSWSRTSLQQRLLRVKEARDRICHTVSPCTMPLKAPFYSEDAVDV